MLKRGPSAQLLDGRSIVLDVELLKGPVKRTRLEVDRRSMQRRPQCVIAVVNGTAQEGNSDNESRCGTRWPTPSVEYGRSNVWARRQQQRCTVSGELLQPRFGTRELCVT